jgi:hypothetical protein
MFYLSVYIIVGYSCAITIATVFFLTLRQYLKHHYEHVLYMALMWFSYLLWCLFHTTGSLLGSVELYIYVGCFSLIPAAYFVVLLGDTITRDSFDPKKLVYVTLLSVYYVALVLTSDPLMGDYDIIQGLKPKISRYDIDGALFLLLVISFNTLFYYMLRVHQKAPKVLRKYTRLLFWGAFIITMLGSILFAAFSRIVPGMFFITFAIGSVLISIAFYKQPRLAFFLPFKALRLIVVNTESGISLYTYNWLKEEDAEVDKNLISGMVQGISLILKKSLKRGNVREISLDEGIMIIHRNEEYDIACVLISSKSSRALREGLGKFAERFYNKFSEVFKESWSTSKFEDATLIINDCFSFIPKQIEED